MYKLYIKSLTLYDVLCVIMGCKLRPALLNIRNIGQHSKYWECDLGSVRLAAVEMFKPYTHHQQNSSSIVSVVSKSVYTHSTSTNMSQDNRKIKIVGVEQFSRKVILAKGLDRHGSFKFYYVLQRSRLYLDEQAASC